MALFNKPALGLDISDHSVEAVLVVREGERCFLTSYGRTILPPGLVQGGEIVDAAALGAIIRKLLLDRMTPPLPKGVDRVAFALPESQVYMHIFEVPRLADERELGASLAIEADGFFPYPHEELAASYTVIAQRPDKKDIYYAAVRNRVLEDYRRLFASIGLTPVAFEAESSSTARAVLDKEERFPAVLVDVGARVVNISVYDRDGIHFSETLDRAGDAFARALSEAEGLPPAEADAAKKERGVSAKPLAKGDRAMREAVDEMLAAVEETVAYYQEKARRPVKKILFCGGSALLPGLMELAVARFGASDPERLVALADPWKSVQPSEMLDRLGVKSRGALIATAIGLGLRGARVRKFREIDFLTAAPAPRGRLVPLVTSAPADAGPQTKKKARRAVFGARPTVSKPVKIAGAVLLALVAAAALWFAGTRLLPSLKARAPSASSAAVSASPATVALSADALMSDAYSLQDGKLKGITSAIDVSVTKSFARAAQSVDAKSAGTIDIVNETASARSLIATTRFLSQDGVLFRLDRAVTIPARGRFAARVTADQPGAQGDVQAGRFTIPGLAAALQAQIYGESKEAMSGGVAYVGEPYTEAERVQAEAELQALADSQAIAKASEQDAQDLLPLDALTAVDSLEITGTPGIGVPTGDYVLKGNGTANAYFLTRSEVESLLRQVLKGKIAAPSDADAYSIEDITATPGNLDPETGTAVVKLSAVGRRN